MNYEDFQHLARLYVVGSLDDDELQEFETGRRLFGVRAEEFIKECRKLNSIFALSLRPRPASPGTKAKLMAQIRATPQYRQKNPDTPRRADCDQPGASGAFAGHGWGSGRLGRN